MHIERQNGVDKKEFPEKVFRNRAVCGAGVPDGRKLTILT
jgi:hypothetical protein